MPTEALRPGVLRCAAPPHAPGVVRLCLGLEGDERARSNALPFRFRPPPPPASAPVAAEPCAQGARSLLYESGCMISLGNHGRRLPD